jgi:rubrerythrin
VDPPEGNISVWKWRIFMSSIQEKIAHTATVAKWKFDQQVRLNTSQTKEKQIQGQIGLLKVNLAEEVLNLFELETLSEESLKEFCVKINNLKKELQDQQRDTESIKAEHPPMVELISETQKPLDASNSKSSGLVCPDCGQMIPVRFCPNCGKAGIPA